MHRQMNPSDALALLLQNQQQIHENIKFADQKAAAFIAINSALLGVIHSFVPLSLSRPVISALGAAAALCLALGIGFAAWTIKPRGSQNEARGPGVIDSVRISQQTLKDFLDRIRDASDTQLLNELRTFIYDRAIIDREKYRSLAISFRWSIAGWLLSLMVVLLVKLAVETSPKDETQAVWHPAAHPAWVAGTALAAGDGMSSLQSRVHRG